MSPFVSVVIPTAGRPGLLPRAVQSALSDTRAGEVEVIVVPNGGDQTWEQSLSPYADNPALRVLPVSAANANVARNHGLRAATGRYVRFLDDDDYLYPEACRAQYELLERTGADICSGGADYVNYRGEVFYQPLQPGTDDLVEATFLPQRRAQPVMHVFRRSALEGHSWRESLTFLQDITWMLDICQHSERKWVKLERSVGAWYWHRGDRVSREVSPDEKFRELSLVIRETIAKLENAGRMTPERHAAAAEGLWNCIHQAFYFSPHHWSRFARQVLRDYPESRPDIGVYRMKGTHGIDPVLVEVLFMPVRWLKFLSRRMGYQLYLRNAP